MNKTTRYIIVALTILVLLSTGWFLFNKNQEGEQLTGQEEIVDGYLKTDEFEILIPENWKKEENLPVGIKAIVINENEEGLSQELLDLGFRSYFSVTFDTLGDMDSNQYIQLVKDQILTLDPEAVFVQENTININGLDAKTIEIDLHQQGITFKVLTVFINSDEEVWGISFNTTQEKWLEYQEIITEIINSFKLK